MADVLIRIKPDGSVVKIYDETYDNAHTASATTTTKRASNVEPIQSGLNRGKWFVDFSPLGDGWRYCLARAFDKRSDALAAETEHLQQRLILGNAIQ